MFKTALLTAAIVSTITTGIHSPIYNLTGEYEITADIGICYSNSGHGSIMYSTAGEVNPDFDYINYAGIAEPGDIVLTVDVLTAGSVDDVIFRDDYIIETVDAETMQQYLVDRYNAKSADSAAWMLSRMTE